MIKRNFIQPTNEEIREREKCIKKLLHLELILWDTMTLIIHLRRDKIEEKRLYYLELEKLCQKS